MRDGDLNEAEEGIYWTEIFMDDFNAEYARLATLYRWADTMITQWAGVTIGMPSDDVIKIHPASERLDAPVNLGTSPIDSESLIVKWSYPGIDLIMVDWQRDGVKRYRVRLVFVQNE